ncbi:MAG: hypothetical protein K2M17_05945 [Bacilli bacterium]|nr:hypothetical protein [Bacilli bacterium]
MEMDFIKLNTPEEVCNLLTQSGMYASAFQIVHDGASYVVFYPKIIEGDIDFILK